MSDSDSDEKSENIRNGNYKSPSKRKRQKGEPGAAPKTYQFDISLSETNGNDYTEVSYLDLVAREEQRLRKLALAKKQEKQVSASGLDPYASDDDDQLKAMAAALEAKYGDKPKSKKNGKVGGKKRKMNDYDHLGEGYDESDPFIDNSECFDEVVPQEITTAHGGFYINTGALEFKENKNAVFHLSSDEESQSVDTKDQKKTKPVKKETNKKQVKFKEEKVTVKNKPKVKNTEVKRKARIINTNPNIKGPKGSNSVKAEVKKNEVKKNEVKNKVEITKVEKIAAPQRPKSPEKSVPKPPEIIDLEAQLEALSKLSDLSKSDSKTYGVTKTTQRNSSSSKSEGGGKQSPSLHDLKLPSSVRVTKVEKSAAPAVSKTAASPAAATKAQITPVSAPSVSKTLVTSSSTSITRTPAPNSSSKAGPTNSSSKGGWQNQVKFSSPKPDSDSPASLKEAKSSANNTIYNSVNNKKNNVELNLPKEPPVSINPQVTPKQATPATLAFSQKPASSSPVPAPASSPSAPMFSGSTPESRVSMFQHDPKNILASTVTTMSSILGTTAPYFAQKLQQKPGPEPSPQTIKSTVSSPSPSSFSKPSPAVSSSAGRKAAAPLNLSGVTTSSPSPAPSYQQHQAPAPTPTPPKSKPLDIASSAPRVTSSNPSRSTTSTWFFSRATI